MREAAGGVKCVKEGVCLGVGGGLVQMAKLGPMFIKEDEKHRFT